MLPNTGMDAMSATAPSTTQQISRLIGCHLGWQVVGLRAACNGALTMPYAIKSLDCDPQHAKGMSEKQLTAHGSCVLSRHMWSS